MIERLVLRRLRQWVCDLLEEKNFETSSTLSSLEDRISQLESSETDSESGSAGVTGPIDGQLRDIHNETWIAIPVNDVPAAQWLDGCLIPGEAEFITLECRQRQSITVWKQQYRRIRGYNASCSVISAVKEAECGDPIAITSMANAALGDCDRYCFTANIEVTDPGNPPTVTVSDGTNDLCEFTPAATQDVECCFDTPASMQLTYSLTGSGIVNDAIATGFTTSPNAVILRQDTQCCKFWVQTGGGGTATVPDECDALRIQFNAPDGQNLVLVFNDDGTCGVCPIVKCGDIVPPPE